jgi:putative transposase
VVQESVRHRQRYQLLLQAFSLLHTKLGNIWHGDEIKIKVKGEWKWLWNMMDEKARFQLVGLIAETREAQDAKTTFKKSKEVANKKPRLVVTDGLPGYHSAFNSDSMISKICSAHS